MADDLGAAPQAGASEPVAAPEPAAAADKAAGAKAPVLSAREAINKAMATVEIANPPNETEKAAAVLKRGQGADDRLVEQHKKTIQRAADDEAARSEASDRATKGWETRRANAEKAEKAPDAKVEEAETKPADAAKGVEPKPVEAAKPAPSKYQPPQRLSPEGKAAWDAAPEPLRADVVRMHDELTAGINKYKPDAEAFSELTEFKKLADEHGLKLKDVMANYVKLDTKLSTDLVGGLEDILQHHGVTLRQVAEHVMGQEPADQSQKLIGELRKELSDVRRELGSVTSTVKDQTTNQRQRETRQQVEAFAAQNPRFEELAETITKEIAHGYDLKTAYERAERLNPAPAPAVTPAPANAAPAIEAQTLKGTRSVSGAPGSGSNPGQKRPVPATARDAINMALSRVGVT